ncbi:MAG TPA: hypothetical protein VG709_00315 [Actinomycetota bacterium]|nr:hypothetical protein [Actinomycetota bacterium]
MGHRGVPGRRGRSLAWLAAIAGVIFLGIGAWAFADPRSFFERIATFPPYNEHFLHDIGSFVIGLGAVLLISAFVRDSLVTAFGGVGIGQAGHAAAHAIDRDLGASPGDPWIGGVAALALLGAAAWRLATLER